MPTAKDGKKICAKCGKEKPANNDCFSRQTHRPDGLNPYCKDCLRVPKESLKRKRSSFKTVDGIQYKTCTRCNEWKPATPDHFSSHHGKIDAHCKECLRKSRGTIKRANFNDAIIVDGVLSKHCTKCEVLKPLDEVHFPPYRQGKNNFHPWCRDCLREYSRLQSEKIGNKVRKKNWVPHNEPPRKVESKNRAVAAFLEKIAPAESDFAKFKAYLIANKITGEKYIGITERKIVDRWRQHLQSAVSNKYGYMLHDAIRHYGFENFEFSYIACALTRAHLGKLEQGLILQYDSVERGYNQTRGGKAGETKGQEVSVSGQTFISIAAAARHYGVNEQNVWQRVQQGWSIEQALELTDKPDRVTSRGKSIEIDGVSFPSIFAAVKKLGLNYATVQERLRNKWSYEQALGIAAPPKRGRNNGRKLTIAGQSFGSAKEAAEYFGISPGAFSYRLNNGWSPEQAAGLQKHRKNAANSKKVVIGDKVYVSIKAACEELNINYGKVISRIKLGWSIKQAFDFASPPPPSGVKNGMQIIVNGEIYSSHSKAAQAYGIKPAMLHKRLKLGWSLEEALGIVERIKAHN